MDQSSREMFEAVKQTANGLIRAHEGMVIANEGIILANEGVKRMADAALQAREEHEDPGETVRRLETLVMEQGADIRGLRDEIRQLRNRPH